MKKEWIDVIDTKGKILRSVSREEAHRKKLLHNVVRVMLLNKGKIYIQQRAQDKDVYPRLWEGSCSGHPRSGETLGRAAAREALEELGVRLSWKELFPLPEVWCLDNTHPSRITPFIVMSPKHHPKPKSEVKRGKWVTVKWLSADMKKHPKKYTPGFRKVWKKYGAPVVV